MRGSPLIRALLAFFVILSLGWPLWKLTSAEELNAAPAPRSPASAPFSARKVHLQLSFTTIPSRIRVIHLEKVVLEEAVPGADIEHDIELAYPKEGVDLRFEIDWPADASLAAARVRLIDPAGDEHEKTVWGKGSTAEVLTFP